VPHLDCAFGRSDGAAETRSRKTAAGVLGTTALTGAQGQADSVLARAFLAVCGRSARTARWGTRVMGWKVLRRAVLFTVLLVLYLASTVPVGLFLYSLKTDSGVNIFAEGGFHAYMRCLGKSFR
jgi:hypothetical protein